MRIQATDTRERLWAHLLESTGKGHKSAALDTAARYYLRMVGGSGAYPNGRVMELLDLADERGSLTAQEIAEVLDCEECPVTYSLELDVGP